MFSRIDLWIGKTLFLPLIIKLCHLLRQSQFAIARLFWFAAMLSGLYRADLPPRDLKKSSPRAAEAGI